MKNVTLFATMLLPAMGALLSCGGAKSEPEAPPPTTVADAGPEELAQIAAIQNVINELGPAAHDCWSRGAADDLQLSGTLVLDVTIGSDRKSTDVKVLSDETKDTVLSQCIIELWSDVIWPDIFTSGQKIQVPLKFVAPKFQYVVASAHAAHRKLSDDKSEEWLLINAKNTGNQDASLSLVVFEPGYKEPLHQHTSAELLFVLGQGSKPGVVADLRGERRAQRLQSFLSSVYIPAGTAHGVIQKGEEPLTFLRLYTPGGPEQGLDTAATALLTEEEIKRPPRKYTRPKVGSVRKAKPVRIADGKGWVRMFFDAKSARDEAAYMGSLSLDPGTEIAKHTHPDSSEFIYILAGEGELYVDGQTRTVEKGDAIQIPKGVEHGFVAKGEDPKKDRVKAIQFYTPSGPEQRFKKKR